MDLYVALCGCLGPLSTNGWGLTARVGSIDLIKRAEMQAGEGFPQQGMTDGILMAVPISAPAPRDFCVIFTTSAAALNTVANIEQ